MRKLIVIPLLLLSLLFSQSPMLDAAHKANQAGKYELALRLYQKALEEGENKAIIFYNSANVYYQMGKIVEALEYYRKSVEQAKGLKSAYHNMAIVYVQFQEFHKSIDILKGYLDYDPFDASTHLLLGDVYKESNMDREAEFHYKQAMNLDPENDEVYIALATLYYDFSDIKRGYSFIEQGIAAVPNSSYLREMQALYLNEMMEYKQAAAVYDIILAQYKDLPEEQKYSYSVDMAEAFYNAGLTNTALAQLRETVRSYPKEKRAIAFLTSIYIQTGRVMEGLTFYESLFTVNRAQSYLAIKDLFRSAYNNDNKIQIAEFKSFYEQYNIADEIYKLVVDYY